MPHPYISIPIETFKVRLEKALSNLVYLKMSLPIAGGVDQMSFKGPFQPKPFCDSMILSIYFCSI